MFDNMPAKGGIYQFYFFPIKKYYIGESCNLNRRLSEHLSGRGNRWVKLVIEKYGLDSLGFQILEFEEDYEQRLIKERRYKQYYGFDNTVNRVEGLEYNDKGRKPVLQYSKEGTFIRKWPSVVDAEKEICRGISDVLLGRGHLAGGYFWIYDSEDNPESLIKSKIENRKIAKDKQAKHAANIFRENGIKTSKSVLGINQEDGEEIIFSSISDAAKVLGLKIPNISACCRNKQKSAGNYEWSFLND